MATLEQCSYFTLLISQLLYDDVRNAEAPEEVLLDFLQSTDEAGANLAEWDRVAFERVTA